MDFNVSFSYPGMMRDSDAENAMIKDREAA